ncbi:MAG: hypothetical protein A2275_06050 [Bacteroidetes bacterium RIFOXYA12_FULL_35_11]|nr:MAG: hypothetical protein A2X01_14930 [Bacteroidetes bacterium GWF2_35_48]OFY74005.1 MAG: hypothetical protein A2275_06050 [Bacteroidetes bacterium RIFOXYA12_FULL_35_11]HBX50142.1 hypothetical protein [Bacteroidales bacterium]
MKLKKAKALNKFEISWNNNYFLLCDFRKHFGHCDVPQNWDENPVLGRWVIRQRVYKRRLTEERVNQLNRIGFT